MRAAVATRRGGPNVLEIRDVPRPSVGPNHIIIRVKAIGLNFADLIGRHGLYPGIPKPPYIPGMELSGTVEEVGSEVRSFKGGERVMAFSLIGSHAEYVAVSAAHAAEMPKEMSFEEGAAFLITSLTAYHGLVTLANVRRGEKLLVHAAAGGVGLAVIQLAKHLGMEVYATASSNEKLEIAHREGADHLINYRREKFDEKVRRLTEGYGVDVVMDSVAGRVLRPGWKLLAPMGRYILYGYSDVFSGRGPDIFRMITASLSIPLVYPPSLLSRNVGILAFNLGSLTHRGDYLKTCRVALQELYRKKVLRPVIGKIFPFSEIRAAHEYLQGRRSYGKVVVTVN